MCQLHRGTGCRQCYFRRDKETPNFDYKEIYGTRTTEDTMHAAKVVHQLMKYEDQLEGGGCSFQQTESVWQHSCQLVQSVHNMSVFF